MTIIGFEDVTRYEPPPPAQAWRLDLQCEQTHDLHEPLTVPGIEGVDYDGVPCPVVLRSGYHRAD